MDAAPSLHPTDQTLHAYGLGKLDDASAEEVNGHLEGCPECRQRVAGMSADSFLGRVRDAQGGSGQPGFNPSRTGSYASSAGRPAGPPPPAETLPPGLADHPDYEIVRELGRGGMGVVYLAHNRLMGRDEVLKVMGREIVQRAGVLDRFLREIRAVARLRHPNIVAAYSAIRFGDSIVFAMEYVEGLDLSKIVKVKGPLPVAHACSFVHQAALGLQHAHEEGLVHRDIKPGNLMLSKSGGKTIVKVLDFGLAKATREQKLDSALTHEGQALGTPDYIAPEQILDAQKADIRADIYSLGGTLFYLLTGRPPFLAKSLYDLYQAHISRDTDPLNLIRPEVPSELAALVAKMMAKDPDRRFQTPSDVAQALMPFFKKPTTVTAPLPPQRLTPPPLPPVTMPPSPVVVATSPAAKPTFESLVDLGDDAIAPGLLPAGAYSRRPPWLWPTTALGALFLGLVLWQVVVRIKTRDGEIVIENLPTDTVVTVDGNKVAWRTDGKPDQIRQNLTSEGFEPIFNGKDLSGWAFPLGDESSWTVKNGILTGTADNTSTTISTARSDYKDFHFRASIRTKGNRNKWVMFRAKNSPTEEYFYRFDLGGKMLDGQLMQYGSYKIKLGGNSSMPADAAGLESILNPGSALFKNDEWHLVEIIAENNTFKFVVDGKIVSAFRDAESRLSSGAISFRVLSDIELRSIEIKTLDSLKLGAEPLFNGRDLAGWHKTPLNNPDGEWNVIGNQLIGKGNRLWLASDKSFSNFALRMEVEFDPDKHRGSLLFRTLLKSDSRALNGSLTTYEVPLGGRKDLVPSGSIGKTVNGWGADPNATRWIHGQGIKGIKPGEWFTIEIVANGREIKTMINGQISCTFTDHNNPLTEGEIHLIGKDLKLRNITLAPLDSSGSVAQLPATEPVSRATAGNGPIPSGEAPHAESRGNHAPQPLFNGKDTTGWKLGPANRGSWNVVNGILEGKGGADGAAQLVTTNSDLANYRLRAKVFNDGDLKQLNVRWNADANTYSCYGIGTGGDKGALGQHVPLGSINKAVDRPRNGTIAWDVQAEPTVVPINDWYDLEVTAIGNKITSYVNGKKVAEFADGSNSYPTGQVALICRTQALVRFKEITIEEFPSGEVSKTTSATKPMNTERKIPPIDRRAQVSPGADWFIDGDTIVRKNNDRSHVLTFGNADWTDYNFTIKAKKVGNLSGNSFGVIFRAQDSDRYYVMYYNTGNGAVAERRSGGRNEIVRRAQVGQAKPNTWYTITLRARGSHFEVFVDDAQILTFDDNRYTKGKVGFGTGWWDKDAFRDPVVTDPEGNVLWRGLPDLP